jgi:hypothetical protein
MGTLTHTYAESLLLPSQVPTDQQAAKQATTRLKAIGRAEWILSILISTITLVLIVVRGTHAGALWRDECAVVNLARMPSVADIAQNFQHEAFPILFPFFVRAYTNVLGTNDFALRAFGILAGVALLCAIWISANLVGRRPPLLSLALLGLNTTFLFWGTTVRGYGFGSAFIVLAFGLLAVLLREISPARIIAAVLVSVAAVQCLVHNLALVYAIVASGVLISIVRHDFRRLISAVIIIGWRRRCLRESAAVKSIAYAWMIFFVFSPGICPQYLVCLAPFVLVLSPAFYGWLTFASSLFLFFLYNGLARGLPWFIGFARNNLDGFNLLTPWSVWPWAVLICEMILFWKRAVAANPSLRLFSLETLPARGLKS